MKLSLAQNISRLRKERGMTQERLAETLGVSFAAVSKWERGAATPELGLIVEMADLFGVSVDALLGYEAGRNGQAALVERLKDLVHDLEAEDPLAQVEDALRRYPNCFEIVYHSAINYRGRGIRRSDTACNQRALELFRHASCLIGQNTDPEISETSLHQEMAQTCLALDDWEKAAEILKTHNPCRLNHALIGQILASWSNDPQQALPYLSGALLDMLVAHTQIVTGYLNLYEKTADWDNAAALLDWALPFYSGLNRPGEAAFTDKCEAMLWALRADVWLRQNQPDQAENCLRRALAIARRFDAAPCYDGTSLRFVARVAKATALDDLGPTAREGLDRTVAEQNYPELTELWRRISCEEEAE